MTTSPRIWTALAAGLFSTALVVTAVAQPPGPPGPPPGGRGFGPPPGGGGLGGLLRIPEVRDELELLDDQDEKLRELERDFRERIRSEMRSRMQEIREHGGDRREMRGAMREIMEGFRTEGEGKIAEVLTTQQMERLKQIQTQQVVRQRGMRGLLRGPVGEELDLSEEQKEQLRERGRELQEELRKKMEAARDEAREELMGILTSEQRQKLETMMGDPLTISPPERGRRGGRGGPPREGRGGRRPGPPGPPPEDEL